MAKNKSVSNVFKNKKQIKKELSGKIEAALPDIKVLLGEKKFNKRIKKATTMLTEGLHLKHVAKQKKNYESNGQAQKEQAITHTTTKENITI